EGNLVHLSFTIPKVESARLGPADGSQPSDASLANYLEQHLSVSDAGQSCPLTAPPKALSASEQFRRFELTFRCSDRRAIETHFAAFFDLVPSHVSLAQIQLPDGQLIQQIFTKDAQIHALSGEKENLRSAGILRYVGMGIMHIFTGIDHMSFLLGLVL